MENKKIAALMITSIITALNINSANAEHKCNDSSIHESKMPLVRDFLTCGQCKTPQRIDPTK